MNNKIIYTCLLFSTLFFSCRKDEDQLPVGEKVISKTGTLLSQIMTEKQPSLSYIYNGADLIREEKSKFNLTVHNYDDKNRLASNDYYTNYDLLSSDLQVFGTALNRIEWITSSNTNKAGTIQFEYNLNGQLAKTTYTPVTGSSQYSEFLYGAGNRISRQLLYWEDKQTGYIEYSYDVKGNLSQERLFNLSADGTAQLNTTTKYDFDNEQNPYNQINKLMIPGINTNINNITRETYTIKALTGEDNVQITANVYEYNSKGLPVKKNGNIEYIYK